MEESCPLSAILQEMRCLRATIVLIFINLIAVKAASPLEKGLLPFSDSALTKSVPLSGSWLFYWNSTFEDFSKQKIQLGPEYIQVPANWQTIGHERQGYGLYVLRVVWKRDSTQALALRVPSVCSAYRLYIDGKLSGKAGTFGKSKAESAPEYFPQEFYFTPSKDTIEIAVEVCSYYYREGGLTYTPSLGTASVISKATSQSYIVSSFIIGLLILVVLYFGGFYLRNREDKKSLHFALLCLSAALRQSSVSEQIVLKQYFHCIPWEWLVKCEFISLFGLMCFSVLYFAHLFEEEKSVWVNKATGIVSSLLSLFVLVTPASISSYIIPPFLLYAFGILCFLLLVSIRALIKKRTFSVWFFLSCASIYVCGVNDILTSQGLIVSSYMLPAGIISFVFVNVVMLTSIYSKAFHDIERLSFELEEANRNQKRIIYERTLKLSEKTWELEKINDVKDKIFSIIAHDLRSPIKTLNAFLGLVVAEVGMTAQEFRTHLRRIQRDTESLNLTLENLLMWSRSQIQEVHTHPVDLDLAQVVDLCLSLYGLPAENKGVIMRSNVPEGLYIFADRDHLSLVLRNVLGNALKFSRTGGQINVNCQIHDHFVQIIVSDTGVGIPKEDLAKLFQLEGHYTRQGTTNERGTGLGLLLCKEYIEKNNGKIMIESEVGKGTTVIIELPATKELFD